MITLCTLFDSHYLNRGLALYESIERYTQDYVMYILAMDEKCYNVLRELQPHRVITINIKDFETDELRAVKEGRSVGEYCWTCKAPLVKYALANSQQKYCAYLDSDLYFYGDPHIFIQEMEKRKASVLLVGHRYNHASAKANERKIGKFCAGTIVFKNDTDGTYMLNGWEKQCMDCCKLTDDGIHFGDQKYLDKWALDYSFVKETDNLGAGIASWNLAQYRLIASDEFGPTVLHCHSLEVHPLFFHYHALVYTAPRRVKTFAMTAWGSSKQLLDNFYVPYLRHIDRINLMLKECYGIDANERKINRRNTSNEQKQSLWKRLADKISPIFSLSGLHFFIFEALPTKFYWSQDEVDF